MNSERGGGLKIFLGAVPGIGKTRAMLLAGVDACQEGRQVVVGAAKGQDDACIKSICESLSQIPMRRLLYNDRAYEEFDLDATLKSQPEIVLLDGLAHRNTPGSRNLWRYQDMEELIAAGIEVWTTLNIYQLESLNDQVAHISGIPVYETVPDTLLEKTGAIELIDFDPLKLIERYKLNKNHVPAQITGTQDGLFDISSLTALREMTFVAAADRLHADLQEPLHRPQGTVLIAVDGRRNAHQAVRAGKRIAARRRAQWTAVYVDTGRPRMPSTQKALDKTFELVERLGGRTAILRGRHVETEILAYARDQNASAIVIAQTRGRPFAGWFRQTLTQRLLKRNTHGEIIVVGSRPEPSLPQRPWKAFLETVWRTPLWHYVFAAFVVGVAVIISAFLGLSLPLSAQTFSLVFLVGVLIVAARTSLSAAVGAAVMSSIAYNFFFLDPKFGIAVHAEEVIATLLFLVVAIVGGNLANRLRVQVAALRATNEQGQVLLALGKRLAEATDPMAAQRIAVEQIAAIARVPACLLSDDPGRNELCIVAAAPKSVELSAQEQAAAERAFAHGRASGYQNKRLADIGWRFIPLRLDETRYGALGIKLGDLSIRPGSEQLLLLDTLASQVTLTLARTGLTSNLAQARIDEERERLRSALLSSVSHDLRTPLASMVGSASTLRDLGDQLSEADKRELLDAVMGEGRRLDRYIQNLLDMTRLGHGTLRLDRDWVLLADVLASALRRLGEGLAGLRVVRDIPSELPLLYVHPALLEQALVNVIENAARFSPEDGELTISGCRDQARLLIRVTDQGPGIPEEERNRVFDMFFSGEQGDTGRHGRGLGLAICRGMVEAHGGSVEALAGPDGHGTTIAMWLPIHDPPEVIEGKQEDDNARQ